MKNLPEDELFDALENRLKNYSEVPDDDVWNKISGVLHVSRVSRWIIWSDRTAAVFALMAVLFMLYAKQQGVIDIDELSGLSSVKNNVPYASGITPGVMPTPTEDPMKMDMSVHSLFINKDSIRAKPHEFDDKSNYHSSPVFDNNVTKDSEISDMYVLQDLTAKSIVEISQDSIPVDQPVKKDSVNRPFQKDILKKERRKHSGLTMYAVFTPLLSYHRVLPLSNDDVVVDRLNSPSIFSTNRLGINIEAGVQGKVYRRLEYIAGISYYHQSQRIAYEQLTSDNVIVEEDGDKSYMVRPGVLQKSFAYDMENIGIQAGLLYSLKQDGLVHKAGVVLSYQKGLRKSSDTEVYKNSSSDYLSYQLLYRVEYGLKSGMSFFIQPTYMHSLYNRESIEAPFSLKQSRAGIGIGVVYSF